MKSPSLPSPEPSQVRASPLDRLSFTAHPQQQPNMHLSHSDSQHPAVSQSGLPRHQSTLQKLPPLSQLPRGYCKILILLLFQRMKVNWRQVSRRCYRFPKLQCRVRIHQVLNNIQDLFENVFPSQISLWYLFATPITHYLSRYEILDFYVL